MPVRTVLVLALVLGGAALAQERQEVSTSHYRLVAECSPPQAGEFGRVLEGVWTRCSAFFKAKPRDTKDDRLAVRLFASRAAWEAAIRADGATPPDEDGCYCPETQTAYVYALGSASETRRSLVRQAVRQYHMLARTRNRLPATRWYADGIAEYLASHSWDGNTLRLGELPLVAQPDLPAQALERARTPDFDLAALVDGGIDAGRPLGWALVRFLLHGRAGKPFPKYGEFAKKMDGGVEAANEFRRLIDAPTGLQEAFLTWLDREQQPWAASGGDWQAAGEKSLRGTADGLSTCRLKARTDLLEFTLVVPQEKRVRWLGGVLLHWTGPGDFSVALLDWAGFIRVYRRTGGGKQTLAQGEGPGPEKDGNYKLQVFRKGENVYLMLGMLAYGPWELPGSTLGIALDDCQLDFRDVTWR